MLMYFYAKEFVLGDDYHKHHSKLD